MDKFRIKMGSKLDGTGKRYFFALLNLPCSLDLSDTVVHFFLDRSQESGELVFRHYTPKEDNSEVEEDGR